MKYFSSAFNFLLLLCTCLPLTVFAVELDRGEVKPAAVVVGCDAALTVEKALQNIASMPLASNIVFSDLEHLRISQIPAAWAFGSNGSHLFAAISTPVGGTLTANNNGRDDNVWEDDCYEFFLLDAGGKNGCHIIINSKTGIYDARVVGGREDAKWNCTGIRVAQKQVNDSWIAVLALPLSELGEMGKAESFKAAIYRASCGKRVSEGINQFRSVFFQPEKFTGITLVRRPVALRAMIDQQQLMNGVLAAAFDGIVPKDMPIAWNVGVSPLDYATNDAYNQAAEVKVAGGVVKAGTFRTPVTGYKLPLAGTIHLLVNSGEQVLFERFLPYDLNDFNQMDIAALYANGDRSRLCADIVLPARRNVAEYTCGLRDANGKNVVSAKAAMGGSGSMSLPLKGVKPGKYLFWVKAAAGTEVSHDFTVLPEKPEWLGNTLGMTAGKAPAPWSDIVIDGDMAKVWNRTIQFKGIPVSMDGAGKRIAENIRFEANGVPMELVSSKWIAKAGDTAKCEAVFRFANGKMLVTSTLEFDGLVWLDCEFTPDRGKALPTIAFHMEMPDGLGRFVYTAEHNANGSVMLAPGDVWSKNMLQNKATFWVGSPERGIFFLADDLRGWKLRSYERSVRVSAEKNGRRIITVPIMEQVLTRPGESRKISFSLQGTPTRPMPAGWSNYRINAKRNNVRLYQDNITELFNVPMPVRSHARADIKAWRDKGVNALPYLATLAGSPFTDEYKWYSEEWRVIPQKRPTLKPVRYTTYTYICPQGEGYADWYLWNIDKMIDAIDANGLYFDFGQPSVYLCSNTLHGCGWKDNHGMQRSSIRIRATRELQKRIYTLLKQKRPDGLVALHNSGGFVPAFHCFSDITWNGEQTAVQVFHNNVSYAGLYEPVPFMLEQNGSIWGVPAFFIPQFLRVIQLFDINRYGDYNKIGWSGFSKAWQALPESKRNSWFLSGLLLVSNGLYSADWGMSVPLDAIHTFQEQIGLYDNAEYFGWFDVRNPFKMLEPQNEKHVRSSSFRGDSGWMVVTVNDTRSPRKIRLSVPRELQNATFRNYPEEVEMNPAGGVLEWTLPADSASFIIVK